MKSLTKIITTAYLLLFFFTPLIFTAANSELFELPKMYFIYSLTIIIVSLHTVNYLGGNTRLFPRFYLTIPLIIFFIAQLLSTVFSADIHTSIYGYYSRLNGSFLSILCYFLLSLTLVNYLRPEFITRLINLSLLSGLFVAVYGIAQAGGIDKNIWVQDVQNRVFSTLGQPNWLAAYLGILLPFSVYRAFTSPRPLFRAGFIFLTSIFYLCLLFTKSKSGLAAAAISLSVYFLFDLVKNKTHLVKAAIIGILVIILSLTVNNPIKDILFPPKLITNNFLTTNLNVTPSEDIRKIVWQGAIKLWQQFPYLGTGPETFGYTYYWTRPAAHNLTSEWDFLYNKAHNEYLNYLATTGTLGFVSYLLLIVIVIYKFISVYRSPSGDHHLSLAIFSAYLSILITNFAGFSVAIISLYFFLMPLLLITPADFSPRPAPKAGPLLSLLVLFISISLLSQNIFYYLADIGYSRAIELENKQQYSQSEAQINQSLRHRPGEPVYLIELASVSSKLALQSFEQKNSDQTEKYVEQTITASQQAINISPFNLNLWKERAQIYYYLSTIDSKYYSTALQSLEAAAKLAPTDAKTFYLLGQFYQNTNSTEDTIKYYRQAIKLKSNYDHALFALGEFYFNQKNYEQAKPLLEQALIFAPTNTQAQDYLNQIAKIKPKSTPKTD